MRRESIDEIRRTMTDPTRVCRALSIDGGAKRQASGLIIRCPVHDDADPSCSVTRGQDGTLRAKCFGCGWAGNVFQLVAAVYSLDTIRDFPEVLLVAAELGGLHQLAAELRTGGARSPTRPVPPEPTPIESKEYPPAAEVESVWRDAVAVDRIEPCQVALALRAIYPGRDDARALTGSQVPSWARYRGMAWTDTGHRVVLPVYAADLRLRSMRAWHINRDYDGPKRLPPAGHRATGLCLANPTALSGLAAGAPLDLIVAEGESDFLSLCQRWPGHRVLGVFSGSWSQEWADRIPLHSEVTIRTDNDNAGDRYASEIAKSLKGRAIVRRAQ